MNFERDKGNYGLIEHAIVDTEIADEENGEEEEEDEIQLVGGALEIEEENHLSASSSLFSFSLTNQRIPVGTLLLACLVAGLLAFSATGENGIFSDVLSNQSTHHDGADPNKGNITNIPSASADATESPSPIVTKSTVLPSTVTTELPATMHTEVPSTPSTTPTQSPSTTSASTTTDDLPACNAHQLREVVAKSKWRYKTADELENQQYGDRCRFLYPRYNCDKGSNTANDMVLEYSKTEMKRLGCQVPRYNVAMDHLIEQKKRLFLCGDSHIAQIYLDILCTFQQRIHKVDYIERERKTVEVTPSEVQVDGAESLPVCHARDGLARKLWGSASLEAIGEPCSYFRDSPPSTLCATFKQQTPNQDSDNNNTNAAVICLMYTRPVGDATGSELCAASIASGVPARHGLSHDKSPGSSTSSEVRAFDTVFANTYVDQKALAESLDAVGFSGKYVLINKNKAGSQMMIPVETANKTPFKLHPFKVDTSAFNTPRHLSMQVLDTQQISYPRLMDSYAVVFPYTGHSGDIAARQVCCASNYDLHHNHKCVCGVVEAALAWTDVRSCRNVARDVGLSTCHTEGHLCLPGIVTDIVTNTFSVALAP